MSDVLYIGGKARPGNQSNPLKDAGLGVYEAVIIGLEDWKGLEDEAKKGLFPSSIDIKGRESEQRWNELGSYLSLLKDLSKSGPLGFVYVGVDGFPENIDRLRLLNYEFKAIEALPATSPAALEARTAFPEDLIKHAQSSESKVLIDVCHLFQTAVYLQALHKPLEVIANEGSNYVTRIPSEAVTWYHQAVQQIVDSGYLAPFAHTNGHIFVAEQTAPAEGKPDQRLYLPDGRIIRAFADTALTLEDWNKNQDSYGKNSYAVPIILNGQPKVAQWFRTHTFVTSGEDEIYDHLNSKKSTQQLVNACVQALILENGKESVEALKREAQFFREALNN